MGVQRTGFKSWADELEHRQKVAAKYQKIQTLQALLDEWESNPQDNDDYYQYVLDLRARLRSARCQFQSMKP